MASARRNGGDRCIGIGCRHDISSGCDALLGAPGDDRRQVADMVSTNDFHKIATSGVTVGPIRGSGLQGQVTTATPFAPHGAGHQEGQRESTVDIGPGAGVKAVRRQMARFVGPFGWRCIDA